MVKLQLSKRIFENPKPTEENTTELFTDLIMYDELNMDKTLTVVIHKENKVGNISSKSNVYDELAEGKTLTVISTRLGKELRESYRITEVREDTQELTKQITGISKFFDFGNMIIEGSKVGVDTVKNYISFLLGSSPINWKITVGEQDRQVEILEPLGNGEDRIVELKKFLNMVDYEMYIGEDFTVHFQRRYYVVDTPYQLHDKNYSDLRIYKSSADVHTSVKIFYKDKEYLEGENVELKEYLYNSPTIEKHGYIRHKDIYLDKAMNLTDVKRLAPELIRNDTEIEYELDLQYGSHMTIYLGSYVDIYKTGQGKINEESVRVTSIERQVNVNNELEVVGITLGKYKLDYDISNPPERLTTEIERKVYNVSEGNDYGKPKESGTVGEVTIQKVKFPNLYDSKYRYSTDDYISNSNIGNVKLVGDRLYTASDNSSKSRKREYGLTVDLVNTDNNGNPIQPKLNFTERLITSEWRTVHLTTELSLYNTGIKISEVYNVEEDNTVESFITMQGGLELKGTSLKDKLDVTMRSYSVRVYDEDTIETIYAPYEHINTKYSVYQSILYGEHGGHDEKVGVNTVYRTDSEKCDIGELTENVNYGIRKTTETHYLGNHIFKEGIYVDNGVNLVTTGEVGEGGSNVEQIKQISIEYHTGRLTELPSDLVETITTEINTGDYGDEEISITSINHLIAFMCETIGEIADHVGME